MNSGFTLIRRIAALWILGLTLFAQTETGQIIGTVTDTSSGVVVNGRLTLKAVDTGFTRQAATNSEGVYVFSNLQPGGYTVSAAAPGFASIEQQAVVTVGSSLRVDFKLEVSDTRTVIPVAGRAVAVDIETQTVRSVVTGREILEFPTFSRDPYALVDTVGNISPADPSRTGVGFAINGQRASGTNVLLDGAANNDEFNATVGQRVALDAVREFSVVTNNFTAEYGRASSGVVNVVTKTGSNSLHGSLYAFGRYSALASNEFDNNASGIPRPVFTRNQFGFSAGGPLTKKLRDKVFFFSNTEWTRVRSTSNTTVYVPTQDFISLAAPATREFFQAYGLLRSGLTDLGTFSKSQFLAVGFDVCKGLPSASRCGAVPATTPLFDRVSYNYPADSGGGSPQNSYMTVTRVDYRVADNTLMYWRYARSSEFDFPGSVSNSPYAGFDIINTQVNNSAVYSLTHTFRPTFISQSKVDFNRFNNQQPLSARGAVPNLTLAGAPILGNSVTLPGSALGLPFGGPQNLVQLYQDLTLLRGKHDVRLGGTLTYLRDNRTFGAFETALELLGNNIPRGMEGFLNGTLYAFSTAVDPRGKYPCGASVTPECTLTLPAGPPNFTRSNRYKDWGAYVQDSWRATPRLTVNYGLRWDVYGTQHNKDPKLDSNFYFGSGNNIFQQIATGSVQIAPESPIGKLWNTNYGNFAVRAGVAWDVLGDGRTSLRGGYGRGYERIFGNVTFNVMQNPPNYAVLSLLGGIDFPVIPVSIDNAGPLAGSTGATPLGKVSLRAVNPNLATAYVDFWGLSLEHKFGSAIVAALEYNGSQGQNQYAVTNINRVGSANYYLAVPCTPGGAGDPGTCTTRLVKYQYSNILLRTNGGFSSYHALNARLDSVDLGNTGLTLRSNFTWSHAIDTLSDVFSSSPNQVNLGWLDPFHPDLEKGSSYYDLRARFTYAALWNIPVRAGNTLSKAVLGGWTLAPVFVAQTGAPFSLYDCTYAVNVCPYAMFTSAQPSTPGTPLKATPTPNEYVYLDFARSVDSLWFNPSLGTSDWGPYPRNMISRNFFRAPGSFNLNLGINKNFAFGESKRLQFRGELFNFFNHPNLEANIADNDVSSVPFVSASYHGRRFVQLGVRLDF